MSAIRLGWLEMLAGLGFCALMVGCQSSTTSLATQSSRREDSSPLNAAQKADLQFAFARSMEKNGTFEQVTAAYQDVLKKDPKCAEALDRLGVVNARKGQFEHAVALYKKALALQPNNADFVCNLGYCFYLQQRWVEAETQFRKAIDLAPDHNRAHNNLGLVLAHSHRSNEALAAFRRGGCSESDAHGNLAFALTLENSWQEARKHFTRAHELNPASVSAEKGLRIVNAQIEGIEKTIIQVSAEDVPVPAAPPMVKLMAPPALENVESTPTPTTRLPESEPLPTLEIVDVPPPTVWKSAETLRTEATEEVRFMLANPNPPTAETPPASIAHGPVVTPTPVGAFIWIKSGGPGSASIR